MVNQEILNSNVSIEEEIYNFEKGLKDDGSDRYFTRKKATGSGI